MGRGEEHGGEERERNHEKHIPSVANTQVAVSSVQKEKKKKKKELLFSITTRSCILQSQEPVTLHKLPLRAVGTAYSELLNWPASDRSALRSGNPLLRESGGWVGGGGGVYDTKTLS